MSDFVQVTNEDRRHAALQKGFNLRFPAAPDVGAGSIYVCKTWQETLQAANAALNNGNRITVRSGGHCYEGFVSNKLSAGEKLAIIDVGLMTGMDYSGSGDLASQVLPANPARYKFRVAAGNQNWDAYVDLYKRTGKTLPGGSCYSVGSGGHIVGGGYGLLSRLHGLTVDWLAGVDILVPNSTGTGLTARHVNLASDGVERELFIACRGAGGGNFGIILNYYFKDLPEAPKEAYFLALSYAWDDLQRAGGASALKRLLDTYGEWFARHDSEWNAPHNGNGGLFTLFKLNARAAGNIGLVIQYTDVDGNVGNGKDGPFIDFVHTMSNIPGMPARLNDAFMEPNIAPKRSKNAGMNMRAQDAVGNARRMDWIALTQMFNGSGDNRRGKYKSSYQVKPTLAVPVAGSDQLWEVLYVYGNDPRLNASLVQIDSYGGAINAFAGSHETCVPQRGSILKSQFQTYWTDAADDEFHMAWLSRLYHAYILAYTPEASAGKPYPSADWQGCYINYPDIDMKYSDPAHTRVDPQWPALYYMDKAQFLVALKQKIDPGNLFRHEMSIPLQMP